VHNYCGHVPSVHTQVPLWTGWYRISVIEQLVRGLAGKQF